MTYKDNMDVIDFNKVIDVYQQARKAEKDREASEFRMDSLRQTYQITATEAKYVLDMLKKDKEFGKFTRVKRTRKKRT
tara:strand:+ start:615 stop:848 length:234 start_codon:yes stop_codon:yes gene_type:complete